MDRTSIVAALVGLVFAAGPAWATEWAEKMFAKREHNFGTVARAAKAEHEFELTNLYGEDVRIASVRSSCGCTSVWVKDNKRVLKTHETGAILAHINSDKFRGSKGATITVTFDRPYRAQALLRVRAYIRDDVTLRPGSVQLGTVTGGTAAERSIEVVPSRSSMRPVEVRSANPHLTARLVPAQGGWGRATYRLVVRLDEQAPAGPVREQLMLVLGDRRTQIPVTVTGRVLAGVMVSPERLLIGSVDPGKQVRKTVIVRGTAPFRITRVRSETDAFQLDAPDAESPKSIHVLPVTFAAGAHPGQVLGTLYIETDQGGEPIRLTARAEVNAVAPAVADVDADKPDAPASPAQAATAPAHVEPPSDSAVVAAAHEEASTDAPVSAGAIPSLFAQPADAPADDPSTASGPEPNLGATEADGTQPKHTAQQGEPSNSLRMLRKLSVHSKYERLPGQRHLLSAPAVGQHRSEPRARQAVSPRIRKRGQDFPLSANTSP